MAARWEVGFATCDACGVGMLDNVVSVRPEGLEYGECPACGEMKLRIKYVHELTPAQAEAFFDTPGPEDAWFETRV